MKIRNRYIAPVLGGVLVFLVILSGLATEASAYTWRTCNGDKMKWRNNWTNLYLNTISFPIGSIWDSIVQNAMWNWNNVGGSQWMFYVGRDTDGTYNNSNGMNEVYWTPNFSDSSLGVTISRWNCLYFLGWTIQNEYTEADIGFNSNHQWTTARYNLNNMYAPYNFEGVALHELGHALGLLHEARWMNTMNAYPNGGPLGVYYNEGYYWQPHSDDAQGARYLYPDSTSEVDVAVSTFKYGGSGTASNGQTYGWTVNVNDPSPSTVRLGQQVQIEFTLENKGTSRANYNIGFYLSTDQFISTSDTLIAINYGAWGDPGNIGTYVQNLTIPSWIAVNRVYYIGIIVDYDGRLGENHEYNNVIHFKSPITVVM